MGFMDETLGRWPPVPWEVMKLTAFKRWKNPMTSTSLPKHWETSGWTYKKHLLKGFTPRTSGHVQFNHQLGEANKNRSQDIYRMCFLEWMTLFGADCHAITWMQSTMPDVKLRECILAIPKLSLSLFLWTHGHPNLVEKHTTVNKNII